MNGFVPNLSVTLDNMLSEWGDIPYAELSVILVHLRALQITHQTAHWTCKSDAFYGDHQLFQRLYVKVTEEIDAIAEKAIGLGNENNVNMNLQVIQLNRLVQGVGQTATIPQPNQLVTNSLNSESTFLQVLEYLTNSLKEREMLTLGLENLLAQMADDHESHVYLLKQRNAF